MEATKEHIIKMGTSRQAAAIAVQDNCFILVIVRICKGAEESLTNLFEWLQKGTPARYIDCDEREPSLLAILVLSKADEVAESQDWVDELAPDAASERIPHEPHTLSPRRLRCAF